MYLAVVVTELSIAAVGTVVTIGTVGIVVNVVTKLTAKKLLKNTNAPPHVAPIGATPRPFVE